MTAWRACLGALVDDARSRFRRWATAVPLQRQALFVFPRPQPVFAVDAYSSENYVEDPQRICIGIAQP